MATDEEEAALLARARLGDQDAYQALYQGHLRYVRSVVRGVLRGDEVEDVCQDTFMLAFRRLDGFAGTCTFRSWITRIALNHCLFRSRTARRLKKGPEFQVDLDGEDLDRVLFGCEDAALRSVGARLDVERLFAQLTERDQELLRMAYLEGMPLTEIAAVLGVTRKAVQNRLRKVRRRAGRIARG